MIQTGKYYNFGSEGNLEAYVIFVNKDIVVYLEKGYLQEGIYIEHDELSTFEFYYDEEIKRDWADTVTAISEFDDVK